MYWRFCFISWAFLALVAIAAWIGKVIFRFDMNDKPGAAFLDHPAVWSDFTFVSIAMGLVGYTVMSVDRQSAIVSVILALIVTSAMHLLYIKDGKIYPTWVTRGDNLTAAGWLHFFYMAAVMSMLIMFYFGAPHVSFRRNVAVSILLMIHMLFAGLWVAARSGKDAWHDTGTLVSTFGTWGVILIGCVARTLKG